jgi:hypothetical protein
MRKSPGRLVVRCEPSRDKDSAPVEINLLDACADHGERNPGVELEDVVGHPRRDLGHPAQPPAALFLHVEADELEDVVGVCFRLGKLVAGDPERSSTGDGTVEAHDETVARPLALEDLRGLAVDEQRRPRLEALGNLTCILDDECAFEPVRAPNSTNGDQMVLSQRSRE